MRGSYYYSEPMPGAVCCLNCGRVSMAMTLAQTEAAVASANAHRRPEEAPVGLTYFRCCPAPRFRPARIGDVPDGATISGVLAEGYMDGGLLKSEEPPAGSSGRAPSSCGSRSAPRRRPRPRRACSRPALPRHPRTEGRRTAARLHSRP